ncbi:hypothetical protein [Neokomagataea anthophila]|uniref:Uncharacterized protein n=1 Tax=Neokomagataea anthophila TaxID=2826925 RepID=A0ABS5E827_9PROT|nr:hypothetical protein [Neokomagataea anthophila]MBR0560031.1 hypothetical protein [Neokomagataea anthophila]
MRRILFALPFLIPFVAHAQQAANPVEPFRYGMHVGTAKNPLYAALSSVVPTAQADAGQAAAPVELFQYGHRVGTQSNPLYINLGNALSAFLPIAGGVMTGNLYGTNATFSGSVTAGTGLQIRVPNSTVTGGILPIGTLGMEFVNSNGAIMDGTFGSIYSNWLIVPKVFSYATLPSGGSYGAEATCKDCWSASNPNGPSSPGIHVYWLNNQWADAFGVGVKHP